MVPNFRGHEAVNQIAFADTILLNKIDLVTPEELQTARDIVRSVNMTANLIECQLADPPPMVFEKKGEKDIGRSYEEIIQ